VKTYRISAIEKKAKRLGPEYLEDCLLLAAAWREWDGIAIFDDKAVAELRATWTLKPQTKPQPCNGCRGL